jgi:hypothetical protein
VAQFRWQKPAYGSEVVAIAQIRWHRTPKLATRRATEAHTLHNVHYRRVTRTLRRSRAADQLTRAIPSLKPRTFKSPSEPAAIRISFLQALAADCPGRRIRRDGAHADTRLFPHKTACLRHGYWLYGQGNGQRLDLATLPEVTAAQRHLDQLAKCHGPTAAMHAYEIASGYLQQAWRIDHHPHWYPAMVERWQQRVRTTGALPARSTWQLPGWAVHPECTALAAVFASPYWSALAIPRV